MLSRVIIYSAGYLTTIADVSLTCSLMLLRDVAALLVCVHQVTENLLSLLDTMRKWISEIPPIAQPQRFGNKAYRTWFQRVQDVSLFSDIC